MSAAAELLCFPLLFAWNKTDITREGFFHEDTRLLRNFNLQKLESLLFPHVFHEHFQYCVYLVTRCFPADLKLSSSLAL